MIICNKFLACLLFLLSLITPKQKRNRPLWFDTNVTIILRLLQVIELFFAYNAVIMFHPCGIPFMPIFPLPHFQSPCIGCSILYFIFYKQSSLNSSWCTLCGSSCGPPSCWACCWVQRFSTTIGICRSSIVILSLLLLKWSDVRWRCNGLTRSTRAYVSLTWRRPIYLQDAIANYVGLWLHDSWW